MSDGNQNPTVVAISNNGDDDDNKLGRWQRQRR